MNKINIEHVSVGAVLWMALTFMVGKIDIPVGALGVLCVLDVLTGVYAAFYNHNGEARKLTFGLCRKVSYLVVICLGVLIDNATGNAFSFRSFIIGFLALGEAVSFCENLSKTNLNWIIPKVIFDRLLSTQSIQKESKGENKF